MSVFLAAALLVSSLATATMCAWYMHSMRWHRSVQEQVARVNRHRGLLQSLASETIEYSKRNPAIIPVLQKFSIRRHESTNSTSPPSGQP